MKRIKILFVGDDIRLPSGVGIQLYKLVKGLQKTGEYDLACIAGSLIPNQPSFENFEGIRLYPTGEGYGNPALLKQVLQKEQPDILVLFSDPRFFTYAFSMDNEFRKKIKLIFYHTWDNEPFPKYNKTWYSACDKVVMLSKFSYNLMKSGGVDVALATHGGDPSEFYRLDDKEIQEARNNMFKNLPEQPSFILFYNNRNIIRKRTSDVIVAFRKFWLTHKDSALIMNTDAIDRDGNDLTQVIKEVDVNEAPIVINQSKLLTHDLNKLYNIADATINIAVAEGFGLSCMESLLTETPGIAIRTGGLTEQMTDGEQTFGLLMTPEVRSLFGTPGHPYIYQDYVSNERIVEALSKAYDMNKAGEWQKLGTLGREYIIKNYHINKTVQSWNDILKEVHATPTEYTSYIVKTL